MTNETGDLERVPADGELNMLKLVTEIKRVVLEEERLRGRYVEVAETKPD